MIFHVRCSSGVKICNGGGDGIDDGVAVLAMVGIRVMWQPQPQPQPQRW